MTQSRKRVLRSNVAVASEEEDELTDVLEVWFAGCHTGAHYTIVPFSHSTAYFPATSDVGGSSVPDTQLHQLSNISLRWMVREVMKAQCGIQFDDHALSRACIPRFNFLVMHTNPDEEQRRRDMADALEPIHDQLQINPCWWLLEIAPTSYSWQDDKGIWRKEWKYVLRWCSLSFFVLF